MASGKQLIDINSLSETLKAAEADGSMSSLVAKTIMRYVKRCSVVDAVVLPCKIGTTVYKLQPWENFVMECTVVEYCITEQAYMIVREKHFNARRGVAFDQIGKSVFLTRKEAENALDERRRKNGS